MSDNISFFRFSLYPNAPLIKMKTMKLILGSRDVSLFQFRLPSVIILLVFLLFTKLF